LAAATRVEGRETAARDGAEEAIKRGSLDAGLLHTLLLALRAQHTGSQIELPLVFAAEQIFPQ